MDSKTITVEDLQQKLSNHENVFIIDVRPADQRAEWKIADSMHVDVYKELNSGTDGVLDHVKVPDNALAVTVCAAGRTSLIAARHLQRRGIAAYSLEGGMKAWNYAWNVAEKTFHDKLKIIQVRRAAKGILSYIIGSVTEALVVDAALEPEVYINLARENGWTIKYVIDTHVHADYVSRTRELARATGVKHLMIDHAKLEFHHEKIAAGSSIHIDELRVNVIHTPGHTWESTTLRLGDVALFTGDTLFVDSVGRPDLKADVSEAVEKAKSLYQSIKHLLELHEDLLVLPAHTSNTVSFDNQMIADSLRNVKSRLKLMGMSESEFVSITTAKLPPTPANYETISSINLKGAHEGHLLPDLEAGGNHCAIR
jgi:glyoxylase-like metal-dependent hydrolase (beta-lactamase superfamily II)/rhodanese-related sulfurtransferase